MEGDVMRRLFSVLSALLLGSVAGSARAIIIIDNGLAPPNPANVIDASNSFPGTEPVVVRESTTVAVVEGGVVGGDLTAEGVSIVLVSGGSVGGTLTGLQDAILAISDGSVGAVKANEYTTVAISGGSVVGNLELGFGASGTLDGGTIGGNVFLVIGGQLTVTGGTVVGGIFPNDGSHVTIRGGTFVGGLQARDDPGERFIIFGNHFAVDGQPVPFGPIAALGGTLTGTLQSGEPIETPFFHACYEPGTCFITLALPEPSLPLVVASVLAIAAAGRPLVASRRR
jgi:hypothetical protein